VHNFQRIEKDISKSTIPFLVAGNGGYYHLHHLNAQAGNKDNQTGATLIFGDDKNHGYLTLTVDATHIKGSYTSVDKTGKASPGADQFSYSAKKLTLKAGDTASL
jgi:hypothetical protein